ncbi:MAG: M20 family peptidase [Deltaproteobacteria bacterium]|nr:M20 family peptidase [Deltaproteobacteria bacterium]
MLKRLLFLGPGGFVLLVVVVLGRALTASSSQPPITPLTVAEVDADAVAERLAQSVRFKTIAAPAGQTFEPAPFDAFHAWIDTTYPAVTSGLRREVVAGHSLLYTWKGLDSSLPPLLLLAHQDAVPVEDSTLPDWEQPPFDGVIDDGWIWGRGTLDDKVSMLAILEAVESLWKEGVQPQRTVMLAFGHDEEVSGQGAKAISELLGQRGIKPMMILDEGLVVTHGIVPGLEQPAALVGLAEKGYLSVEMTVAGAGGHSSMPPPHTAVGILAEAVTRLEANPLPAHMEGPMAEMLATLGPEMDFGNKIVFRNLWLLGGIVQGKLEASYSTNAAIRTTTAVTMFDGGVKENVLPQEARAVVNFRIFPGDTIEDILRHVEDSVDDSRVKLKPLGGISGNPPPVSTMDSEGWAVLTSTVRQAFPDAVVAPGMSVAATDARMYAGLSDSIYRFSPIRLHKDRGDTGRIHGTNERVGVENYAEAVRFYAQLISNAAAAE